MNRKTKWAVFSALGLLTLSNLVVFLNLQDLREQTQRYQNQVQQLESKVRNQELFQSLDASVSKQTIDPYPLLNSKDDSVQREMLQEQREANAIARQALLEQQLDSIKRSAPRLPR